MEIFDAAKLQQMRLRIEQVRQEEVKEVFRMLCVYKEMVN